MINNKLSFKKVGKTKLRKVLISKLATLTYPKYKDSKKVELVKKEEYYVSNSI